MTASSFLKQLNLPSFDSEGQEYVKQAMIAFAKYHVQKAVESIHNDAQIEYLDEMGEPQDYTEESGWTVQINPSSIRDSYNLDDIV